MTNSFQTRIVIGIGSNLGDRHDHIRQSLRELSQLTLGLRVAPIYETAPMYITDQPAFLNTVAIGTTTLGPFAFLEALKQLEARIGRQARERNGPREIDLDLLAYGSARIESNGPRLRHLQAPHPRIAERRFVLAPLADLDPELYLPGLGRVDALLRETENQSDSVVRLDDASLPIYRA